MSFDRRRRGAVTAEALMKELRSDPEVVAREQARAAAQAANLARYRRNAAPVLADLADAGYPVETIGDLRHSGARYPGAVPVLLHWLPRVRDGDVKEDIVRTLSVPWARPSASREMATAFKTLPAKADEAGTGLRWAIGNALEVLAHESIRDDMLEIARNRSYGPARQMVVLGLARLHAADVVPTLLRLLDDEEVAGHAVMSLGRLRVPEARGALEQVQERAAAPWVRAEARKALTKIGRASDS